MNNYRHATIATMHLDRIFCQIRRNRVFHVPGIFDEREGGGTKHALGNSRVPATISEASSTAE